MSKESPKLHIPLTAAEQRKQEMGVRAFARVRLPAWWYDRVFYGYPDAKRIFSRDE